MSQNRNQKIINSKIEYSGEIINVRSDLIELGSGARVKKNIVEHPGSVVIIPKTKDDKILMVSQWRHAVQEELIELPAGHIDFGETPKQAAVRELQEEIGFKPKRLIPLSEIWVAPGWCNEKVYSFLALDLIASKLEADKDEDISVLEFDLDELLRMIDDGELVDAKTIVAIINYYKNKLE